MSWTTKGAAEKCDEPATSSPKKKKSYGYGDMIRLGGLSAARLTVERSSKTTTVYIMSSGEDEVPNPPPRNFSAQNKIIQFAYAYVSREPVPTYKTSSPPPVLLPSTTNFQSFSFKIYNGR
jgi:hypothetical protein